MEQFGVPQGGKATREQKTGRPTGWEGNASAKCLLLLILIGFVYTAIEAAVT